MAGFENDTAYFTGIDTRGVEPVANQMIANGQLLIGAASAPYIRVNTLTSSGGSVTITNGPGTINLEAGAGVATTYNADSGSATPSGNIIVLSGGTNGIDTTASGNTITFNFDVTEQPAIATSYPCDSGTATPAANVLTLTGQNSGSHPVMDTTGSGSTATFENRAHLTPIVVDSSTSAGTRGTYSTIAAALTAASSGNDIFIRPGTYTENLTLKAGVNLVAFKGDELTPSVTIIGNATMSSAGTCTISNIRLQTNGAALLTVSGSAASIVNLENCYLNATNNTGIIYSSSDSGSNIRLINCRGDLGTTGIALFTGTGAGAMNFEYCKFTNSGNSTTASAMSSTGQYFMRYSLFENLFSNSGTGAGLQIFDCVFNAGAQNSTVLALSSTAGGGGTIERCFIGSGTATAVTIGASAEATLLDCNIQSSNTNTISGSGTLNYANLMFSSTSSNISVTTQKPKVVSNNAIRVTTPAAYPYTTLAQDELILVDTASARTITPMASPITGQKHIIKDSVGSAASNNITITPSGKNIDGAASSTINIAYGSVTIVFGGSEWHIV
jgi:hypothetical protein